MWLLLSSQLLKIKNDCWAWSCLPEILVVERLRQRSLNSKANPGNLEHRRVAVLGGAGECWAGLGGARTRKAPGSIYSCSHTATGNIVSALIFPLRGNRLPASLVKTIRWRNSV